MGLDGIDLLDLDRFQRLEHHEMFKRLRAEAPVSWHDHPAAKGFWNVVRRSRNQVLYFIPPMIAGYAAMEWAIER